MATICSGVEEVAVSRPPQRWINSPQVGSKWDGGGLLGWGWIAGLWSVGPSRYPKFVRGGDFSEGHLHVLIDLQPAVSS